VLSFNAQILNQYSHINAANNVKRLALINFPLPQYFSFLFFLFHKICIIVVFSSFNLTLCVIVSKEIDVQMKFNDPRSELVAFFPFSLQNCWKTCFDPMEMQQRQR
jgi:hypothetical protein